MIQYNFVLIILQTFCKTLKMDKLFWDDEKASAL